MFKTPSIIERFVDVRRQDVAIAKNYLNENEMRELNRIVTMYLDYAETQAERRQPLHMKDWREKLDGFLRFNEHQVLENSGKVSMEVAKRLASTAPSSPGVKDDNSDSGASSTPEYPKSTST